jgi:cytoskeletal protein CcmA (bactofilin family)
MSTSAGIGPSIRIKGEIIAREPFLVAGQVDGTIDVDGHMLTIAEGATVAATVTADTITIEGTITGEVSASAKVVVHETASVDGAIAAPTVSVREGATVNARIQTTKQKQSLPLAS